MCFGSIPAVAADAAAAMVVQSMYETVCGSCRGIIFCTALQ